MAQISRGAFLKGTAAASAALLLAACSTGSKEGEKAGASSSAESGAFPVTLESPFGSTEITEEPKRVVGIGWINAEIALSLGTIPVGSGYVGWGENDNHSTDWFDKAVEDLDGEMPTRFPETDGVNYEEIAKLEPDVILAVVGAMDQETFDKLGKIAPVVTYSKDFDSGWTVPWQDCTRIIGKALGRADHADEVIADAEKALDSKASEFDQLEGASFISSALSVTDGEPSIALYIKGDARSDFMTSLGMTQAEVVTENSPRDGSFYMEWSNEKASELESDVLYSWVDAEEDVQKIKDDSVLSQIPAVKKDAAVLDADKKHTLAMGYSPLGVTWLAQETDFIDQIADAVSRGK